MDLSLTKEQKLIRDAAAEFLKKECPRDLVRQMENDDLGYPPELWSKMAELGWLGLIIAEEYGGLGGSFLDLVVLLEEMGKYLVPSPIIPTEVLGGLSIMYAGTEEHKKKYLPKVAKGELLLTMALNQNNNNQDGIETDFQITKKGKDSMISGTRLFVPYAHVSDYIVCPIQMKDNQEKENELSLFLIEGKSSGVSCTQLETTACDKQCKLVFNSVKLDRENILSGCRSGSEVVRNVLERAALAQCALMIGGGEAVLRMTVDHAKKESNLIAQSAASKRFSIDAPICWLILMAQDIPPTWQPGRLTKGFLAHLISRLPRLGLIKLIREYVPTDIRLSVALVL